MQGTGLAVLLQTWGVRRCIYHRTRKERYTHIYRIIQYTGVTEDRYIVGALSLSVRVITQTVIYTYSTHTCTRPLTVNVQDGKGVEI